MDILAAYFLGGLVALSLFDLLTKRIRSKLQQSVTDAQVKLAGTGILVGRKAASALFLFSLWVFWPAVLLGAITGGKGNKQGDKHGT